MYYREAAGGLSSTDESVDELALLLEEGMRPEGDFATTLSGWREYGEPWLETDDYAKLCSRAVASQLINPEHIQFSKQTEMIHPPEEKFANKTDYRVSAEIDNGRSISLQPVWRDRVLVVPAIALSASAGSSGNDSGPNHEPAAFMIPGTGIIHDRQKTSTDLLAAEIQTDEPEYTRFLDDDRIIEVLRHILTVARSTQKQAQQIKVA